MRCNALSQWSSCNDPVLTNFEQFLVENFCEFLWFVSLVPLGVGTTCLGTLDPLDYVHFMLNVVRHKNVYNSCPLKYEVVYRVKCFIQEGPKFIHLLGGDL